MRHFPVIFHLHIREINGCRLEVGEIDRLHFRSEIEAIQLLCELGRQPLAGREFLPDADSWI